MSDIQNTQMEKEPPTGIKVLVVGGGIGGLTFAIEANRKGHSVQVFERNSPGQGFGQ
jgi:2-polyprenyl-6-methoxyphenol hydroxylase-like FAD-dependent oxidoreductase